MQQNRTFVIFDTEFTSWKGCIDRGWNEDKGEYKELVQIGAVKCNCIDLTVESKFSILSKPKINPKLSEYFVNLTGITNQELQDSGTEISTAIKEFLNFVNGDVCYSFGDDKDILEYNVELHNLEFDSELGELESNDIRPIFKLFGVQVEDYDSGTISRYFEKEPDTTMSQHNAVYDCMSLRLALKEAVSRTS